MKTVLQKHVHVAPFLFHEQGCFSMNVERKKSKCIVTKIFAGVKYVYQGQSLLIVLKYIVK